MGILRWANGGAGMKELPEEPGGREAQGEEEAEEGE